ncbi:osteoglycin, paralog a [Amia ocellicauda]|uniref:osteoglycin, paralog a n=1 Tax=Amia ocellicauda TaxID=2972642 RepID=UPI00346411BB
MIKLRPLFFSFILVSWILSATVAEFNWGSYYMQQPAIANKQDILLNDEVFMEAKKPKKVLKTFPDDDTPPPDTDLGDYGATPAPGPEGDAELPTCLLCVCLSGSVYCEEVLPVITAVPTLPKETAYLYARYNKIAKISVKDFSNFPTLRRIDLTGNAISEIEDGSFSKLVLLEELSLAENKLVKLPALPAKLTTFNANFNRLRTRGVKANAFKKLINLSYLYLANNELEAVPPQLPESLRILHLHNNNITTITDETFCKGNNTRYIRANMDQIRLDGNPVILAQYPNSFTCLKSLPIGRYY